MSSLTAPITIPQTAPITNMVLFYDGIQDFLFLPAQLPPFPNFSLEAWVYLDGVPGTQWKLPGTLWANPTKALP